MAVIELSGNGVGRARSQGRSGLALTRSTLIHPDRWLGPQPRWRRSSWPLATRPAARRRASSASALVSVLLIPSRVLAGTSVRAIRRDSGGGPGRASSRREGTHPVDVSTVA